jgi:transcriptional regulator with XRE-family HTH domain
MAREKLSPEALALIYLRLERGCLQKELAARKGFTDYRPVSRYESGENTLRREDLDEFAALLGHSREAVDALIFTHSLVTPSPEDDASSSPLALTATELRRIDRAAIAEGWTTAENVRRRLIARKRGQKAETARREAGELWTRLKTCAWQIRRELVTDAPEYRSWALAERVCEASVRAAADSPQEALELADLALLIAEGVEGTEDWRQRVQGFVWAHIGNARRVANDLSAADEAFTRSWELWRAGAGSPDLLPEWRILSLEASLRRDERRFAEALELLDLASRAAGGDPAASGRILLKKEHVYEQMGDQRGALAALVEAAPFVEALGDPRLLFALRFNMVDDLCHLERYPEAAELLPLVRELAERSSNELDLIRVVWLAARVASGQGKREEAIAGLEQVRRDFTARGLPYDASLSSLDLAVLYLKEGRAGEVKDLAREMAPVFTAQGIAREALASLTLFREAVHQQTVTVELTSRIISEIKTARHLARGC